MPKGFDYVQNDSDITKETSQSNLSKIIGYPTHKKSPRWAHMLEELKG